MPSPHFRKLIGVMTLAASGAALAGPNYTYGKMTDMSAIAEGLLIRINAPVPDNCAGTPYGWMLIPATNKPIMAAAMMFWATGKRTAEIYTVPATTTGPNAFCTVTQLDTDET